MAMPSNNAKIMVCQLDERTQIVKSDGMTVTLSPVSCLNAATTEVYGLIILCFSTRFIRGRCGIVELCRCLKSNSLAHKTPVFASIDRWHRGIAGQMQEAGLDFMGVRQSQNKIDSGHIFDSIRRNAISIHIDQIMSQLCPFLNYAPLNSHSELITCGAWRNRMVLGGKRLHEVCEAENHLHCEYFLNPRLKI
ncbi:MAG: hypothetical protein JSW26_09825 [Desulfobacterales bacterium]|nr:MAG: hypothetical protein JSW26_09825 [Desulfobacterales bacterium]